MDKVRELEFRTIEEFEEHYFPEYCKKYPIRMRVSGEEAEYLKWKRGKSGLRRIIDSEVLNG